MNSYLSYRRNSCIVLSAITLFWVYFSGKDLNWDFLNYHLYGASLLIEGRWEQDYFAGSVQSYLNPISYLPLYLMTRAAWPDVVVAAVLTLPALLAVWIFFFLSEELVAEHEPGFVLRLIAVLLAITTALWLIVIGSTFNDSLTCVLVLGSLCLILRNEGRSRYFLAGVLLGSAVGVKLTNGVFALPMLLACAWLSKSKCGRSLLHDLALLSLGVGAGFILLHGYWSWKLWQEFGNPFFPFFNGIFKSSDFPPFNLHDKRFMASGWMGVVELPFEMPGINSWIYNETRAPEIKPLVFMLTIVAAPIFWLLGKLRSDNSPGIFDGSNQKLLATTIFLITSYVFWAMSSRIGRYAIPVWVLLGIALPGWLVLLLPGGVARVIATLLLVSQLFFNFNADISHWTPVKWGGAWFDPQMPKVLQERPHTILTASLQSYSALVPYAHPESRWSNVFGQYSLGYGGSAPQKLNSMINKGDVIALVPLLGQIAPISEEIGAEEKSMLAGIFLPFGLDIVGNKCWTVRMPQTSITPWSLSQDGLIQDQILRACPMAKISDSEEQLAIRKAQKYDAIFAQIEKECPANFSPPGAVSSSFGEEVGRYYFNNSSYLYSDGNMILARPPRQILRNVVALIDPENSELKSNIFCYANPTKLYLN